jgi:hypothetical protein
MMRESGFGIWFWLVGNQGVMRWFGILLLAGCGQLVPAITPAQLSYTPGPPVVITDDTYESSLFRLRYPRGWRAITSAAFSEPWVVFASPDEKALIVVAVNPDDTQISPGAASENDELQRAERTIPLEDNSHLTAALVAPRDSWDSHIAAFERVVESVRTIEQSAQAD